MPRPSGHASPGPRTDQFVELNGEYGYLRAGTKKDQRHQESFHTQRNWKMANDANAGTDSGSTSRMKAVKCEAPSIYADSNRSLGSCEI